MLKCTLEAEAVFLLSIFEIANLRVHVQLDHSRAHVFRGPDMKVIV